MKVRPLPTPQIFKVMDIKYEVIFKGATFKNREIEIYLPEYKYSQFILPAPIGDQSLFGTTNDDFWRSHPDLKIEVRKICNDIAYKHLWFLMGWDLRVDDQWSTIECWKYYLNDWRKNYKGFNPTDEQFQWAINSYSKKYVREKGQRTYTYIPKKVYNYQDKIELLEQAIDLAGDGGCDPFTEEEHNIIIDFLTEIKNKFVNKDKP